MSNHPVLVVRVIVVRLNRQAVAAPPVGLAKMSFIHSVTGALASLPGWGLGQVQPTRANQGKAARRPWGCMTRVRIDAAYSLRASSILDAGQPGRHQQ
jgi:hypothetical protein